MLSNKIAVVILNWNGKSFLEKFLPSVVKHSIEAKIIVADNASTDDSISFLEKTYPSIDI
ncbi:MAG: glycosyltransferase family 2 protein, partial [Vicingaceae bacterium]